MKMGNTCFVPSYLLLVRYEVYMWVSSIHVGLLEVTNWNFDFFNWELFPVYHGFWIRIEMCFSFEVL